MAPVQDKGMAVTAEKKEKKQKKQKKAKNAQPESSAAAAPALFADVKADEELDSIFGKSVCHDIAGLVLIFRLHSLFRSLSNQLSSLPKRAQRRVQQLKSRLPPPNRR